MYRHMGRDQYPIECAQAFLQRGIFWFPLNFVWKNVCLIIWLHILWIELEERLQNIFKVAEEKNISRSKDKQNNFKHTN